jgi:hypothetical protein
MGQTDGNTLDDNAQKDEGCKENEQDNKSEESPERPNHRYHKRRHRKD